MQAVLAVDIGGTKMAAGLVGADGKLTARRVTSTPAEGLWDTLAALIDSVGGSPVACGVGCGGPMLPGGVEVSPLNIPAWRGFPLLAKVREHTGLPTWIDNDAKALALGEGWVGAAAACSDFMAMVVSTGVGGGIVLNGRLLEGATGNAGHIGHLIVEPGGALCGCGARGCLEAEASGSAIERLTGRPAAEASEGVRTRTGTLVGRAVADVANLLDLRLAVVGGSVALGYGEPFFVAARAELDACARIEFAAGCEIVPAGLGDAGPLVGAGAVGWRGLGWGEVDDPAVGI